MEAGGASMEEKLIFVAKRVTQIIFAVHDDSDNPCTLEPKLGAEVYEENEYIGIVKMLCVLKDHDDQPFTFLIEMEGGFGIDSIREERRSEALRREGTLMLYNQMRKTVAWVTEMGGVSPLELPEMSMDELERVTQVRPAPLSD
jgi:preprotein translocase subunit SecB